MSLMAWIQAIARTLNPSKRAPDIAIVVRLREQAQPSYGPG